jgi:Na+/H+-dicarboxylate symporter
MAAIFIAQATNTPVTLHINYIVAHPDDNFQGCSRCYGQRFITLAATLLQLVIFRLQLSMILGDRQVYE